MNIMDISDNLYMHPAKMKSMVQTSAGLKRGGERRLEFIEFRLFWEGGSNRADIRGMFGASVPQASKDFTLYQERESYSAIHDVLRRLGLDTPPEARRPQDQQIVLLREGAVDENHR